LDTQWRSVGDWQAVQLRDRFYASLGEDRDWSMVREPCVGPRLTEMIRTRMIGERYKYIGEAGDGENSADIALQGRFLDEELMEALVRTCE
jgi:hypothetical protein